LPPTPKLAKQVCFIKILLQSTVIRRVVLLLMFVSRSEKYKMF
jgi:hypothetical protein